MSLSKQKLTVPIDPKTPKNKIISEKFLVQNILRNFQTIKLQKLLKLSGEANRYQYFMLICLSILAVVQAFFITSLFFHFLLPDFSCKSDSGTLINCTLSDYCSQKELNFVATVPSIVENFNLICHPKWLLIKTLGYIFLSSSLLAAPLMLLNHILGRKIALFAYNFIQVLACLLLIYSSSFSLFTFGLTINVSCAFCWLISGYLYIVESSGKAFHLLSFKVYTLSLGASMFCCGFVCFNFFPFKSVYILLLVTIIVFSFFYFALVESPVFLKGTSDLLNFYLSLREIARINFSPRRAQSRKEKIKRMLFDEVDPSLAESSLSIQSNDNEELSPKPESLHLKSFPLNHKSIRKNKKIATRKKIFSLSLSRESALRLPAATLISLFYCTAMTLFSAFLTFIFWFSLQNLSDLDVQSSHVVLSTSFALGVLSMHLFPFRIPSSFSILGNLVMVSLMLTLSHLTTASPFDSSPPSTDLEQFHKSLFGPLLFAFNYFSGIGFFSCFKASLEQFKRDEQLVASVLVIFALSAGISLGAYFTSSMLLSGASVFWAVLVVCVLAFPLSLLSPSRHKQPFSNLA